jgi:hypothetical protein
MSQVTYYPAQTLSVGGTNLKLVQSADVDFSISRQDIFEFGTFWAVDNIQVEPATAILNFSYGLSSGANNHTLLGIDNFGSFIADVNGKQYILNGAGVLTMPSGLISSYSVEGSVGNIPTVNVSVQSLNVTYAAGNPTFPNDGGNASVAEVARPDQISVTLGGTTYECRSFTYTLDIPREYVNKLGALTPIANIMTAPPKVTIEAEIILRGGSDINPKFANDANIAVAIDCGLTNNFEVSDAKLANFTSNTTLDDIQVASVTLEAPVKGSDQVKIAG